MEKKYEIKDTYKEVIDRLLDNLKEHGKWVSDFAVSKCYNIDNHKLNISDSEDKKYYNLFNQLLLRQQKADCHIFATFGQYKNMDLSVNKGEKCSYLVQFYPAWHLKNMMPDSWFSLPDKERSELERADAEHDYKTLSLEKYKDFVWKEFRLKLQPVFNILQTDMSEDVKEKYLAETRALVKTDNDISSSEKADALIEFITRKNECPIEIKEVLQAPCYTPSVHKITSPSKTQFSHLSTYYADMFHEITHSLKKRDEKHNTNKHSESYAREEFIAEIGSCLFMNYCGLENERTCEQAKAYIDSWTEKIKDCEPKELVYEIAEAARRCETMINDFEKEKNLVCQFSAEDYAEMINTHEKDKEDSICDIWKARAENGSLVVELTRMGEVMSSHTFNEDEVKNLEEILEQQYRAACGSYSRTYIDPDGYPCIDTDADGEYAGEMYELSSICFPKEEKGIETDGKNINYEDVDVPF